jgi:putative Mg2+ transporter-C (MgtC) family protein
MITNTDIILRLLVAAILGGLVGYERERNNQPAGLRTHIILVVGAALAMILSANVAMQFHPLAPNGDPGRMAAQVISGIGFLGVGAIIRYGPNIKGLTTATSLWSMAIVGLVVGAGYFVAGAFATGLFLVALILINLIEKRYIKPRVEARLTIIASDRMEMLKRIRGVIEKRGELSSSMSIQKNIRHKRIRFVLTVKLMQGETNDALLSDLADLDGIRIINVE